MKFIGAYLKFLYKCIKILEMKMTVFFICLYTP